MMDLSGKRSLLIFIFLLSGFVLHSQVITVFSERTREPVVNVALFNSTRTVSTLTDNDGKANISIFRENDSIFFQHPTYNPIVFLYQDLRDKKAIFLVKRVVPMDEFVISASKSREYRKDLPYMIDIISESDLSVYQAQSSADILTATGNIVVQKSQGGGGSPILRGFEANKILLVVDGVRMNNAIYRSGHLQNSITIDQAVLDRIEVIYGPTSLIYGSDALGGVIHYYTREPRFADTDRKVYSNVRASSQVSTANGGMVNHLSINAGLKNISFLTSLTGKNLGNVRMGKKINPYYGDYGKLMHFVEQVEGRDTTVENQDPYIQVNTGYSQYDFLQKIRYAPSGNLELLLNVQYSTSSKIHRFDELNDYRGADMNYAEYYYGPQNRLLGSLKTLVRKENFFFTSMTTIIAYQRIDEDRINRRFRSAERLFQEEDLQVYSLNMDFLKYRRYSHRLHYGIEMTYNDLLSGSWYENTESGVITPAQTRYPGGGSETMSAAAYASYRWVPSERYVYSAGLRYHYGLMNSSFMEGFMPYDEITISNDALTGSISMVFNPGSNWQFSAIVSRGFRNPNVDDYGKVRAKDNLVTVPNPELSPEYTWNVEAGINKEIEGYLKFSISGWHTWLKDAIVRTDFRINHSDSLYYDGEWYGIITNSNAGEAYIRGLSLSVISDIHEKILIRSSLNLTEGWNKTDDDPLGHIPPLFGRTEVSYNDNKFHAAIFSDYNGWKSIDKMSSFGEDNAEEGTEHGFPGWVTLNARTGYLINDQIRIQFAVENILDRLYKPFASAVAAPGRNFIITIRADI